MHYYYDPYRKPVPRLSVCDGMGEYRDVKACIGIERGCVVFSALQESVGCKEESRSRAAPGFSG